MAREDINKIKQDIFAVIDEINTIENNINYVSGDLFDAHVYKLIALEKQLSYLLKLAKMAV